MGKDQEFLEAARNGNIAYLEKILNQKAKRAGPLASLRRGTAINCQDTGGYSALHHACLNGHIDIVKLLLIHEASTNLPDMRGSSPLHLAAWAGEDEIVRLLLTHPYRPANPNLQTIEKETPLHCAAQHGHTESLKILLSHSADPNMRNSRGETPLDLACQYGRLQAVHLLIRSHPELIAPFSRRALLENQALQNRSRHSSPLPHSSSISTPSPSSPATPTHFIYPHTCLHVASRNGHKQIVEILLAAGVNVNLLTPSGTALHEAALCGKESVVRTLLKAGIDLNATDAEDRTVLDILKEFPPHVTKHIMDVITNFRSQMDTDETDDVMYRHQSCNQPVKRNHSSASYYQKQHQNSHNNNNNNTNNNNNNSISKHYHFNSNNHLLNHSHSMQQSSYSNSSSNSSRQRYSTGHPYNGGKSLDSGLEDENNILILAGRAASPIRNQSILIQQEMGVSPSSSMSSFEPPSISPRSRAGTSGVSTFLSNAPILSSFIQISPPKKPPRRNLSVSPTHTESTFSYSSPNHQVHSKRNLLRTRQSCSPSNDSPSYSHQSHSSVGGFSTDDSKLKDCQNDNDDNRDGCHSSTEVSLTTSSDILDKHHFDNANNHNNDDNHNHNDNDNDNDNEENLEPNIKQDVITNSMKRPKPAPRNLDNIPKEHNSTAANLNNSSMSLKSYNPNRKLKRNRNTCSLTLIDNNADAYECDIRSSLPQSPTNYKQPPTPDHPPPSSSQAERTIHERIRPLSQEYKRRSALWQLHKQQLHQQQQQQRMIDTGTSPLKQSTYDYAFISSPIKANLNTNSSIYTSIDCVPVRASSNSLSSSVSLSDHSASTDNVEELDRQSEPAYATINKQIKTHPKPKPIPAQRPQQQLPAQPQPQAQAHAPAQLQLPLQLQLQLQQQRSIEHPQQVQIPVYATIHKKRGITTTTMTSSRPPIPAKPVVPERTRQIRNQPPQLPLGSANNESPKDPKTPKQQQTEPNTPMKSTDSISGEENLESKSFTPNHLNGSKNEEKVDEKFLQNGLNESSNEDSSLASITTASSTSHEVSILSPFNAEEARKKISEIIESFGTGILNSNLSPTNDFDLDFDDVDLPLNGQILVTHLHSAGLLHLKKCLFENGYDNYKFMNGFIESEDLDIMKISSLDGIKLLKLIRALPKADFLHRSIDKAANISAIKPVSLMQWLQSIDLTEYIESFNKHLYNSLESVYDVWDVELQTVLEINKLGHRKRILQSIKTLKDRTAGMNPRTAGQNGMGKELRHSTASGYRKNRPAPQPPGQQKPMPQTLPKPAASLQIRSPAELLFDLPENLRTKWRHSPNTLLNQQIKYIVNYLGSTVVNDLRGTESTRKSIELLKQDHKKLECMNTAKNMLMSTVPETNAARDESFRKHKEIMVTLAVSYRGVEFLDITTKNTICEHEIQNINCACQDPNDLRYFAYITKEDNQHYCHGFYAETNDSASEIILTLGQAFEVAYQLALRDGISTTPLTSLNNTIILQGLELENDSAIIQQQQQ